MDNVGMGKYGDEWPRNCSFLISKAMDAWGCACVFNVVQVWFQLPSVQNRHMVVLDMLVHV